MLLWCGHVLPYRSHFKPSWDPFGAILGCLGPSSSLPGAILEPSWALLAPSWPSWAPLGALLGPRKGHIGAIIGPLDAILAVLGPSWSPPGAFLSHVKALWKPSWALLAKSTKMTPKRTPESRQLNRFLGPFWGHFLVIFRLNF